MTTTVRDLMSSPPVTVPPTMTLRELAALLAEHEISGVPVVADEKLVGVVSESDIIEKERGPDEESHGFQSRLRHERRAPAAYAANVGEAMSVPPVFVEAWMSPYEAAWLMSIHDVNRLPVVDRSRLVGVLARADLVRYFARPDAEIQRDIHEDVIDALGVADVSVLVRKGRVLLEGEVDSKEDLRCLRHAVSRVPGVVAIDSRIRLRGAGGVQSERPASVAGRARAGR